MDGDNDSVMPDRCAPTLCNDDNSNFDDDDLSILYQQRSQDDVKDDDNDDDSDMPGLVPREVDEDIEGKDVDDYLPSADEVFIAEIIAELEEEQKKHKTRELIDLHEIVLDDDPDTRSTCQVGLGNLPTFPDIPQALVDDDDSVVIPHCNDNVPIQEEKDANIRFTCYP